MLLNDNSTKKKITKYCCLFFYNWDFFKVFIKNEKTNPFLKNSNLHVSLFFNKESSPNIQLVVNTVFKYHKWYKPLHIFYFKENFIITYMALHVKLANNNNWSFTQIKNFFFFKMHKMKTNDMYIYLSRSNNVYIYFDNQNDFNYTKSIIVFTSRSNRPYCNNTLINEIERWSRSRNIKYNYWY